jgi:predicted AlkP superfamily pyrophosphatase or phosphodiesterase
MRSMFPRKKFLKSITRRLFLVLIVAGLSGCAAISHSDGARARHVFIISFDQGNPDLIERSDMPVFHKMAAEGARTWNAYTIVPSLTLPSHTSMLTGIGPQQHQVLWNDYEPDKGLVKVPTIFSIAKQHGLVTAMFVGKEKFKHLNLPESVDEFVWPQPEDDAKSVAAAFAKDVGRLKPNLCFIHFRDPDTAGHQFGAESPEKVQALRDCDAALETIRAAIAEAGILSDSVIILTADHGSHNVKDKNGKTVGTHGSADSLDVRIPWVAWGRSVKKNYTIESPVIQYDTAATGLWLLGIPIPDSFWGRPVKTAFE